VFEAAEAAVGCDGPRLLQSLLKVALKRSNDPGKTRLRPSRLLKQATGRSSIGRKTAKSC